MKIFVINGPNLNLLGIREVQHYGSGSYEDLVEMISKHASKIGADVEFYQSNHEGDLVDFIHKAYFEAGAMIATSNTFGANPIKTSKYEEYIISAINNAKKAKTNENQ